MPPKNKPEYNVWGEPVVPWEEYTHISTSKKKEDPGEDWMDDYYFLAQGTEMDDIRGNMDAASRSEMLYSKKDGKGIPNPLRASGLVPLVPTSFADFIAETALTGIAESYRENPVIGIAAGLGYGRYGSKLIDKGTEGIKKVGRRIDKNLGEGVSQAAYEKAFFELKDDPMLGDIPWKKYSEFPYIDDVTFGGQYSPEKGKILRRRMGLEKEYEALDTGSGRILDEGTVKDYTWKDLGEDVMWRKPPHKLSEFEAKYREFPDVGMTKSKLDEYGKGAFKLTTYPLSRLAKTAKRYLEDHLRMEKGSENKLRLGRFLGGRSFENVVRHEGRHFFQNVEGADIKNRVRALKESDIRKFQYPHPKSASGYPSEYTNITGFSGKEWDAGYGGDYNTMNRHWYDSDEEIKAVASKKYILPEYLYDSDGRFIGRGYDYHDRMEEIGVSKAHADHYKKIHDDYRYYRSPIEIDARLEEIVHSGEDIRAFRSLEGHGYSKKEIRGWADHYKKAREKIYGTTKKR